MKNHRFLWLRNRTTDNRKCEKARNIKEKRTIEMFNTVSRPLVVLHSSQRDKERSNSDFQEPAEIKCFCGFSLFCAGAKTTQEYPIFSLLVTH